MSCRPTRYETKLRHGPVVFKRVVPGWRVMPGRWPDGPYYVGLVQSPVVRNIFIFSYKFSDFNKKIFIITKFELKIYDVILNNAIKIFYSIFINGLGRANRVDHWA
jgi:hypothetical protein